MKRKIQALCCALTVSLPTSSVAEITVDRFTGDVTCDGTMILNENSHSGHLVMGRFRYLKIDGDYHGPFLLLNVTSSNPVGLANGDANFLLTGSDDTITRFRGEVISSSGSGPREIVFYSFDDAQAAEEAFASATKVEYRLNGQRGNFLGSMNASIVKLSLGVCSDKNWPE